MTKFNRIGFKRFKNFKANACVFGFICTKKKRKKRAL